MKIDTSRLKRGNSDVSPECQELIERLRSCSRPELAEELAKIDSWTFGNFSRHLYSSIEHLSALLLSVDMDIVLGVLNLLYMFSKRSNYLSRLTGDTRAALLGRLNFIAESWGGREYGLGLAECCRPDAQLPPSATIFYYEYYNKRGELETINMDDVRGKFSDPRDLTLHLVQRSTDKLTDEQRIHLFMRLRSSMRFHECRARLQFVQARLQALSVLVYSDAIHEKTHSLIYPGFLEELVELLELQGGDLVEIHAAALRTMTSIIHLDRNPTLPKKPSSRLGMIIDVTGANSYHGFLPTLVRACIGSLTAPTESFPLPLATALFSFLYHLATYEVGGESLVACGMMESLLRVINWQGTELEHITFVTRAVRVIDLITNIDMASFQAHAGLASFIARLEVEVRTCRADQPDEIISRPREEMSEDASMEPTEDIIPRGASRAAVCLPQRAALLKSMLNFLKKAIQDRAFAESMPHVMEGTLPASLRHIISNAEYYGPSLFLLATDVVTVYVFQEPSLLSALQDNGLTDVVLQALLQKDVPATREVLGSLPNVFSALCLNSRGLEAFLAYGPFDRLFRVLLSPTYLPAMRRRRSSIGDTATNLGNAVDELMRHQPRLRQAATAAIVKLLKDLVELGSSARFVCWRPPASANSRDAPAKKQTPADAGKPSLLSALQDNGLTDVVLQALLQKDVPATREVLGSLPNVFSALCLNSRGLEAFLAYGPFDRLFRVLLSPTYLPAMRRRRSSIGDTATNLGNAVDELMRHQPRLRQAATAAIVKLLKDLVELGSSARLSAGAHQHRPIPGMPRRRSKPQLMQGVAMTRRMRRRKRARLHRDTMQPHRQSNSDDHCREFVSQGGLKPLLQVLALPNLPVDCPVTASAQSVAAVCKSIMSLAFEPMVLGIALEHLSEIVGRLEPLQRRLECPGGSVLLSELAHCPDPEAAFATPAFTPLLHAISAAHGYIVMLVHVCRTGQNNVRTVSLQKWGQDSEQGLGLLRRLVQLYTALVWESTLLLALCTDDIIPPGCDFGKEDLDRLLRDDTQPSNGVTNAMENLTTTSTEEGAGIMEIDLTQSSNSSDSDKVPRKARSAANPTQLRYINVLLSVSSRLGRALAELFGLLVKLCVGSPIRQRRGQTLPAVPPCFAETSREIGRVLSFTLVDGLSYDKLPPSPFPKMKFTYLICSIGFTMPMLFDERRYAFHLMLQKFVQEGGLRAFFEVFDWALTSATSTHELPESTVEFMNEWLTLLERLINPKAILHSPHVLPARPHGSTAGATRDPQDFDVVQYMVEVQRKAFHAIQKLRNHVSISAYSDRMHEYILVILKHIFKAEAIIKERQTERVPAEEEEPPQGDVAARVVVGRGRGLSITATSRFADATAAAAAAAPVNPQHLRQLMDMGFSHEHCTAALRQASTLEAATDLLLNMPADRPVDGARNMDVDMGEEEQYIHAILMSLRDMPDNLVEGNTIAEPAAVEERPPECPPIPTEELDRFTDAAVYISFHIIDTMPGLVSRALELLATIAKRNGEKWRDDLLTVLLDDVISCLTYYEKHLGRTTPRQAFVSLMGNTQLSEKTNNRLHLLRLMLDPQQNHELRFPTAQAVGKANLLAKIFTVIERLDHRLTHFSTEVNGPKWFPHLVVLFNQIEQVAAFLERREAMTNVCTRSWRWYDVARSQWNTFSPANSRLISTAFAAGETSVRIRSERQRFTVNLGCMSLVNEETGAYQPVILALKPMDPRNEDPPLASIPLIRGLEQFDVSMVLEILIDLLPLSVDANVKLSLMKVCLRVTRHFPHAKYFAQHGGIEALLRMRQVPGQPAFLQMALLLIRHAIEEPRTLELAMESVIASRLAPNVPTGYRDLIYLTRQVSAAVARSPETYTRVAKKMLRLDASRRGDDDTRLLVKLAQPPTTSRNYVVEDKVTHEVINAILGALVASLGAAEEEAPPNPEEVPLPDEEDNDSTAETPRARSPRWSSAAATTSEAASDLDRPLLSKGVLLRFLSDLVRSYQTVALIVAEHTIPPDDTPLLAYLIDTFIPGTESSRDRECNASARMLISSLAAMSGVGKIQSILIHELKSALVRTWQVGDMARKCVHIQLLAQLIPILIEGSPPEPPVVMTTSGLRQQLMMPRRNNMFYGMVRLNLIDDLAKVTQQVDFANPHAVATLNAALKPLETLLRLTNQPSLSVVTRRRGQATRATRRTVPQRAAAAATATEEPQRNVDLIVETVMMSPENGGERAGAATAATATEPTPAPQEGQAWGEEQEEPPTWHDLYTMESSSDSEESESAAGEENAEPADMENEEEEEPEEAEAEEPSDLDVDEETRQFIEMYDQHVYGARRSPTFGDMEREQDDVITIQYPRDESTSTYIIEAETPATPETPRDTASPRVYFHTMYEEGGAAGGSSSNAASDRPAAATGGREGSALPTTAAGNLQLLMGSPSQSLPTETTTTTQRTNRMRRYQYLRSIAARSTSQPVILQRLLGSSTHISSSAPFRDATRVVLMDNGFGIFSPQASSSGQDEGAIDVIDRADYMFGRSLAASLNNTPSVLSAWVEESKLLGLETQSYICLTVCDDILRELEVHKATEMATVPEIRIDRPPMEGQQPPPPEEQQQSEIILRAANVALPNVAEEGTEDTGDEASAREQESIRVILMTRNTDGESEPEGERNSEDSQMNRLSYTMHRDEQMMRPFADEMSFSEGDDDVFDRNVSERNMAVITIPDDDDEDDNEEEEEDEEEEEVPEEEVLEVEEDSHADAAPPASNVTQQQAAPQEAPSAAAGGGGGAALNEESSDALANVPAGIDPSFLAALPAEMRHEVIEEHLRVERNREEAQRNAAQHENHAIAEINSEFLAALPPNIQEEVLAQQRIDLRQQAAATANPNDPVDAAAFFQNLSPALRQSILTDMEDSQISVLPPELAAEAQNLRRDWQLMQEHVMNLLGGASGSSPGAVLRYRGRDSAPRSRLRGGWGQAAHLHGLGESSSDGVVTVLGQHSSTMDRQGNALLDQEALASLLVMLFVDAPKFNVIRFHRVVRSLCFHPPTRRWIIRALLAIMERTGEKVALGLKRQEGRKRGPKSSRQPERPTWLNIRLDPALGSRANVFIYSGKKLLLHPQAASFACRHALELLTLLAKTFAANFMPTMQEKTQQDEAGPSRQPPPEDFWAILLRLDSPGGRVAPPEPQKRTPGAHVPRPKPIPVTFSEPEAANLEESPFGRLIVMLRARNIRKSKQLTDKLLRLLAYVSIALPKEPPEPEEGSEEARKPLPDFIRNYSVEMLKTIVEVLSEKSCSEDGLDDIATLLVNVSQCSSGMRESVIDLLLGAVTELAQRLEEQIRNLMEELAATATEATAGDPSPDEPSRRGTLQDRFTREVVVVSSEGRPRATGDLQLPSMAPLVAKTSNQTFFLRTLKIIFQIRKTEATEDTPLSDSFTLDTLWQALSDCLELLKQTHDHHAVLVFQSAVEAFFLMHAPPKRAEGTSEARLDVASLDVVSPMSPIAHENDLQRPRERQVDASPKKHRTVLNQILRQYTTHLADGPFAVLVDHTRILDFDVKRRYFRTELERCDEGIRREELAIHVNRMNVFEDSFRELYRRNPEEWKNRFYIAFEDEEGQDAGGLLREWYVIISREIFNPNYALFTVSPGDRVTYMINPSSHANSNHLCYYKFVGRVIAKAIYDNKLLECYFTRSLYKHILGIRVKYTDMESEDYEFYKGLVFLKENHITALGYELTFSLELQEFGVTEVRDLIPNGRNITVTEENKLEYIRLVCQLKMSGSIKQQLNAFLDGFYDIIPKRLISIFNEQELELLISGLPNVDIEDLRAKYRVPQIQS
uniref:HECT-type E3 ubiquitin transferase n=1 Tax=Lutzomyia longipalpis TaxID=7200 RepID=A0A1B0GIT8_LUTLO